MLAVILGIIVVAIFAILVLAATKPNNFVVQRSTQIAATPETVFALIDDFRKWRDWSPWEGLDPDLKRKMSGTDSGRGAVYEWDGNKKVGSGRMEIVEASAPNKLAIKLDFLRPFEAHNMAEFTIAPQGRTTHVNWTMQGSAPFMTKVMQTVMNFDKMIGKDFEKGLASLKAIAERN
ncbi:MAG: polyketide cyclase [Mesorhizobium sp. SCN 65-20]|nr:MAG: polyketide cyclase [Mesorhizobium sp. SCN 65-20]